MIRRLCLALALLCVASAPRPVAAVEVLTLSSDAWLRSGPSTRHARITGLARGTAVVELAEPNDAFRSMGSRWVRVHVLEGRAKGRDGWVWGRFVSCCVEREWLVSIF